MKLREWRKSKGLTQAQVAELLKLSQPTVARIERGDQFPNPETIAALLKESDGAVTASDLHSVWSERSAA